MTTSKSDYLNHLNNLRTDFYTKGNFDMCEKITKEMEHINITWKQFFNLYYELVALLEGLKTITDITPKTQLQVPLR